MCNLRIMTIFIWHFSIFRLCSWWIWWSLVGFFHVGINLSKENLPTTSYKTTLIPIQRSMSKTYFKIALLDFFWDIVEYKVISSHIMVDMTDFFLGEIHFSSKFSSIPLILPIFCLFYLWFKTTYCKFVFRNSSSLYKRRSETQGKNDSSFVASINITINPVDSATDQEEAQRDTELFNSIQIPIHQLQADSK